MSDQNFLEKSYKGHLVNVSFDKDWWGKYRKRFFSSKRRGGAGRFTLWKKPEVVLENAIIRTALVISTDKPIEELLSTNEKQVHSSTWIKLGDTVGLSFQAVDLKLESEDIGCDMILDGVTGRVVAKKEHHHPQETEIVSFAYYVQKIGSGVFELKIQLMYPGKDAGVFKDNAFERSDNLLFFGLQAPKC